MRVRLFSLIFLLILLPAISFAQQQGQGPPVKKTAKTILDFKDELKLSSAQINKLTVIIESFKKNVQPLTEKIISKDKQIRGLLNKGGDLTVIKAKVKEDFSMKADLVIMEIEAGRDINGVLTPEQLAKWNEIKKGVKR